MKIQWIIKKALKILNSFVEEELDGDIDAMRAFVLIILQVHWKYR